MTARDLQAAVEMPLRVEGVLVQAGVLEGVDVEEVADGVVAEEHSLDKCDLLNVLLRRASIRITWEHGCLAYIIQTKVQKDNAL